MAAIGSPYCYAGDPVSSVADMEVSDERVRVLVCGSRTFTSQDVVTIVLDGVAAKHDGNITIIHGAARGADTLADKWAKAKGVPVLAFAADWNRYGRRGGYVRNAQMISEGEPDVCWAFVDRELDESRGTAMMVRLAIKAEIPTYVVRTTSVEYPAD